MDISEGGDDQGSGWMQVKKKHRSNSKFSLHGWVGELSGRQRSRNSSKNERQPSVANKSGAVSTLSNSQNSTSTSSKDESINLYLDKCVVSQGEKLDSRHLEAIDTLNSGCKLVSGPGYTHKDNVLPKIKWGDLDEETLVHYEQTSGAGTNFVGIENHNPVPEVAAESLPYVAPLEVKEDNFFGKATDENQVLHTSQSLSPKSIYVEERDRGTEMSSEDVKEQITSDQNSGQITNVPGLDIKREYSNPENDDSFDTPEESMSMEGNSNSTGHFNISVVPVMDLALSTGLAIQYSETLPSENIEHVTASESELTASVAKSWNKKQVENSNEVLDNHNRDAISSDITIESKERFRERLWCFLFENLNRAVDELYLLCELECDLDQMKEASLVLEEAASDFRELKSRVENFEKLKKSSSHEIEGASLMMPDNRRPHALSWEVRRMTTSPRRAEILSSSLEAFRKIQQERSSNHDNNVERLASDCHIRHLRSSDIFDKCAEKSYTTGDPRDSTVKEMKQAEVSGISQGSTNEKKNLDSGKSATAASRLPPKAGSANCVNVKSNKELHGSASEVDKVLNKKDRILTEHSCEKNLKSADAVRRRVSFPEREREKRNGNLGRSMDAWKEKRNWEDILASPHRVSSRFSYSPGMMRKSAERGRVLHDKLMSPEKKKKSSLDLKKEAEEKHARATRIRTQLENERVQKLQRSSEKLNRVSEWQNVRSNKLRESVIARHQRSESRHEAYLAQVVRRAGDESSKVNEVRFITSLNEENKKHILRKKLQDSESRRAEKLQVLKTKQKEDMAREEAVLERKRLIEFEKLQRLAETQRRKEEAQVRREEERKASSAAREAKALEQMRKKEVRAKAQQEEAELLAQKLAERLSESELRRKFYLEQIRERASMDFRDQSSPLLRRFAGKEAQAQGRSITYSSGEDSLANNSFTAGPGILTSEALQHSLKRRIKRIRQRLMSLKHEFPEASVGLESSGIGYRTVLGTARGKIGRWLQDLQRLRQARKDGAASFGLITAEMIKFLEGRDAELHASRLAGLLDFIASALPASHTSKPEACQVTIYLLRLLKIVLAIPSNRFYFLVQNLLPPIIPLLAAALENYIKMAAAINIPGPTNLILSKTSSGNLESISETVDGFLWTVAAIIGYASCNELELQMQDGLVELVIAYQIIHRLRDLFALYDRPQVEGLPFPSFILLSINLLVVLTSKFRESSSIDWESFPNDVIRGNNTNLLEPEFLPDVADSGSPAKTSTIEGLGADNNSVNDEYVASKIVKVEVMDVSPKVSRDEKCEYSTVREKGINPTRNCLEQNNRNCSDSKQPAKFLLSALAETGLVCLPSMLTAVLLQANIRLSAEQGSYVLPSNFEEVATGVLKVLNNIALIDVTFIQQMLARPDLKMEFFHLMSFLLSHCTSNWGVSTDKIGLLLLESLQLLGYFALFHPGNQAVLRWGKSPTILHKVCDIPFVFFTDPDLMPILAGTLVAASYGCEQNKAVIQQELSMDMLLPSLKSCKSLSTVHAVTNQNVPSSDDSQRSNRNSSMKGNRSLSQRALSSIRGMKTRNQRESKGSLKLSEESSFDMSSLLLHSRFPLSFINKAEQFFSAEVNTNEEMV